MKNVTLSAKWLGVVFAALFLAACSSNETKEAEAAASAAELGQTAVTDDGTTVTITSCVEKGCAGDATMGNTITIE